MGFGECLNYSENLMQGRNFENLSHISVIKINISNILFVPEKTYIVYY